MSTQLAAPAASPNSVTCSSLIRELENNNNDNLKWFARHLKNHPWGAGAIDIDMLIVDMDLLDAVEGGCDDFTVGSQTVGTTFQDEVWPLIGWWARLQDGLFCDITGEKSVDEWTRPAVTAMGDFLSTVAVGVTAWYVDMETAEGLIKEMLRRYRIWTRTVCALVKEVWPDIDWSNLDQVV
jgi:hypothetical protein